MLKIIQNISNAFSFQNKKRLRNIILIFYHINVLNVANNLGSYGQHGIYTLFVSERNAKTPMLWIIRDFNALADDVNVILY